MRFLRSISSQCVQHSDAAEKIGMQGLLLILAIQALRARAWKVNKALLKSFA